MQERYDAIIVGAGVIGAAIAFELAKKGHRTLNVDKLPAAGYGSTSNTCAIVRTHYSTLEGTALAYESFHHWTDWPRYCGDTDERGHAAFVQTGMLVIKSEGQSFERHLQHHDRLNIPYEVWDVDRLAKEAPLYDLSGFYPPRRPEDPAFGERSSAAVPGALFIPSAGYVNDPQLSTHNLQRAAEAHGAEFRFNQEVVEILRNQGNVTGVRLRDGHLVASTVVVNAAGPHSFVINRMADVLDDMRVTTRALRHEVHYLPAPPGYGSGVLGGFTSDDDLGEYHRPEAGGLILVGSQDPKCDPLDWVDDPDDFNREVTEEQWRAQVYRLALRMPALGIPSRPKGIADLYDVTEDWMPIYDRSGLGGFYMAVGTSGNQYKNAPMVGRMMAALIEACESGHDHDHDPVSVEGPYTGLAFDVGFYSRNREPIQGSSFSVLG